MGALRDQAALNIREWGCGRKRWTAHKEHGWAVGVTCHSDRPIEQWNRTKFPDMLCFQAETTR
ncbi:MAG: hypothetical protein IIC36_15035 [Gemmatimonadetes bacterium]|nr:hypothetical protein [Gemmatimonadota bacterium]